MATPTQRSFNCHACNGIIYIPYHLPPTVAPCPHCGASVTSPPVPEPTEPDTNIETPQVAHALEVHQLPSTPHAVAPAEPTPTPLLENEILIDEPNEENPKSNKVVVFSRLLVILFLAAVGGLFVREKMLSDNDRAQSQIHDSTFAAAAAEIREEERLENYYIKGWVEDAENTLNAFLKATTPDEKAKYVLGGTATLERILARYGDKALRDSVLAECFFPMHVYQDSRKSNIFLMTYHCQEHVDITRDFRPLISIEMLNGLKEIDPMIASLADISRFNVPRVTIQAYFKKTDQGMLLDWDVFAQTRFQELSEFRNNGKVGDQKEFRVIINKQHQSIYNNIQPNTLLYRISDPAFARDNFPVHVNADSPLANELKKLEPADNEYMITKLETATVLLEITGNDEISLKKLICWQFKGLGATDVSAGQIEK